MHCGPSKLQPLALRSANLSWEEDEMTWKSKGPVRAGSAQRKTSAPLRRSASCTASNTSGATRFRDRNTLAPAKVAALRPTAGSAGPEVQDGVIGEWSLEGKGRGMDFFPLLVAGREKPFRSGSRTATDHFAGPRLPPPSWGRHVVWELVAS
uniref:Uncharacterized protein n=1 Tax=Arundo donax TaxID=35708 RepID=A0A0A9DBF7_ARUDO